MFDGFFDFVKLLIVLCFLFIPLGLWKLVDIIIWMTQNISVTLG